MTTITQLPEEVITIILEHEIISMEDIGNFKGTCKRFRQITLLHKFWEKKFYQRCPTAEKKYNKDKQNKALLYIDLKKTMQAGLNYIQELQYYANVASGNKLNGIEVENLMRLLRLIAENSITYYFVWDEIKFAQKSRKLFSNLIYECVFKSIFNCLKQYRFTYKQIKLTRMPKTKILLEKQLTILAQYVAPHVSYSVVKTWLDEIVQTILFRIRKKYPAHSIFSTTSEQLSFWRDNNINNNFWNETESKQIMRVLEEYIFSELEIHKLHQMLKTTDLEEKYIKHFAECFRRHLLTITYHIIARRLGVYCCLIKYENNLGIMCQPNYYTSIWYNAEFFYVNPNSNLSYPSNIIRGSYQNKSSTEGTMKLLDDISVTRFIMEHYNTKLIYHKLGSNLKLSFIIFTLLQQEFLNEHAGNINIESIYRKIMYEIILMYPINTNII